MFFLDLRDIALSILKMDIDIRAIITLLFSS